MEMWKTRMRLAFPTFPQGLPLNPKREEETTPKSGRGLPAANINDGAQRAPRCVKEAAS